MPQTQQATNTYSDHVGTHSANNESAFSIQSRFHSIMRGSSGPTSRWTTAETACIVNRSNQWVRQHIPICGVISGKHVHAGADIRRAINGELERGTLANSAAHLFK